MSGDFSQGENRDSKIGASPHVVAAECRKRGSILSIDWAVTGSTVFVTLRIAFAAVRFQSYVDGAAVVIFTGAAS